MNPRLALAAVFMLLALVACSQTVTAPEQNPFSPYSRDDSGSMRDRGGGAGGGGEGGSMN